MRSGRDAASERITTLEDAREALVEKLEAAVSKEEASEAFLNIAPLIWDDAQHPLLGHTINPYQPLMQRIDEKTITAVINDSKEDLKEEVSINKGGKPVENENWISIDDFAKPDLRIARVLECGHIDKRTLTACSACGSTDIDYGTAEAHTTYGRIGIKVWIFKGEVLPDKKQAPKNGKERSEA